MDEVFIRRKDDNFEYSEHTEQCFWDYHRSNAYERWIKENVKDKVVCDLGAGSGILCYLAYYYGARHVYGIELRPTVVETLWKRFEDIPQIEIIHSDVLEDPWPEADIYLHEFIGNGLVDEYLDELIFESRRRGLVEKIQPNTISIVNGKGKNYRVKETPTKELFDAGGRDFIERFEDEVGFFYPPLFTNDVGETTPHWEGHIREYENHIIEDRVDLYTMRGEVLWEMSFDGQFPVSNWSQPNTHWTIDKWNVDNGTTKERRLLR